MIEEAKPDGRTQRAVRHKDAVVRALLESVREHGRVPTVADLAQRAGVSRRTVFRLFDDMESLHMAATAIQRAEVIRRWPPPFPTGQPIEERIELLVTHRASVYEHIRPLRRVAETFRAESAFVRSDLEDSHAQLRMHAEMLLGDALPTDPKHRQRAARALGLNTGFPVWRSMREDDALSIDEAKDVMAFSTRQLLR
ncbi:MAG: hypothetical protein WBG86_01970 [Polyangiales bacterium]